MIDEKMMIAYGPVPSRRLGQSVGINNIPPKICTYSCVYCQLGRTLNMQVQRKAFYKPEEVVEAVKRRIRKAEENRESIDYLTFVPDGEPTLDENLGKMIELLRKTDRKIAVISNASLIWREDVRKDLSLAHWVSLKIDAVDQDIWHAVNRPHQGLKFQKMMEGMREFSKSFAGDLATETMLIQGMNDKTETVERTAAFIKVLKPKKSYVSIPIRPPAEKWVKPASEFSINSAYQIFKEQDLDTEYLIGYEGNAFAYTGNVEEDLLSIVSVHPMRKEAVDNLLAKAREDWDTVKKLIKENKIIEIEYQGNKYYMRKLFAS
jgi:wyosine [tRNA(Phe)-imidazoG37] synthetase (radical SAM superfamily)